MMPENIAKVGVVGAGLMGAEIALVFALGGMDVLLNDRDASVIDAALVRLARVMDKAVARGVCSAEQREQALGRVRPAADIAMLGDRDLVTEAVFESLEVKRTVLQALDQACRAGCVIASNTSTIPISTLAATLSTERRPHFLGTHYFSPVSRMQLVEIIPGFDTDPDVTALVTGTLKGIGKAPVLVKDVAGFAVNRMLHAMIIEAIKLVEEGVATPEDLDTACRLGLGHPIGPFALMDAVTSGLSLQVQDILHDCYGERFRPPALLKQRVAAGYGGGTNPGWIRKAE